MIDPEAAKWEFSIDDFRAKYSRLHKIQKKDVHYGLIPIRMMVPYAASDAHYTWALFKKFQPLILADPALRSLYVQIESRLLHVLLRMEHKGVVLDRKYLQRLSPEMSVQLEELKKVVWESLGAEVNIESNIQVIPLLQAKGVRFYKRTKIGSKVSLDKEVLEQIASKHQVAADLQTYRETRKLKTTYVDNLIEMSAVGGKIHCEYNQNVTTGRMSSRRPNLTNVPRGNTIIRTAFIPPKVITCLGTDVHAPCGYRNEVAVAPNRCPKCHGQINVDQDLFLLLIDFSQIEIRLTAHFSEDPILLDVYNNTGEDVHLRTCCEMFGYQYKEAEKILQDPAHTKYKEIKKYRQIAKMINFLIIYGGGAKNLAVKISTPQEVFTEEQCKQFIRQYFDRYRGVARWIARSKIQVQRDMGVQNYFGRYRRLTELKDAVRRKFVTGEKWKIERALRQGVNHIIQSSAADLFKIALIRVDDNLRDSQSRIVMPIHDELIFYFHKADLHLLPKIKHDMEDFDFRVPIVAEFAWATTSWTDKKELKIST
jgi:DNA polymerase-1